MSGLSHALPIIRQFEGCRLRAYPDPGTGGDPWTIGWGATGPGIARGVTWTQEQADARLLIDAARYERGIRGMVSVPLSERQLGALVSWAYNVGLDAARRSTLIRLLNAGNYAAAADQFRRWNRAGGRVMAGLSRRRAAEETLFRAGS